MTVSGPGAGFEPRQLELWALPLILTAEPNDPCKGLWIKKEALFLLCGPQVYLLVFFFFLKSLILI